MDKHFGSIDLSKLELQEDEPSPILRPDQIGMQLADELIAEAQAVKDCYSEGKTNQAYEHIVNCTMTVGELMKINIRNN